MKILAIAFCLIMVLGMAGASQYPFGTKVTSYDSDFGAPLCKYVPPANPAPYFSLAYWETGVVNGYDDTDVVYLHQGVAAGPAVVLANDIRLTPFGYLAAGSKVTPQDNDIGMRLNPLSFNFPTAAIGWVNSHGGPGHDLDDPVYLHPGPIFPGATTTDTNDVRLTEVAGLPAGSKVGNLDPDLPNVFANLWPPNNRNPITNAGPAGVITVPTQPSVMYVDINGNSQYDYPDDVYLITGTPPSPVVRVNDVRLSGPV